jgi:excisionase family DNA binding protein
MEMQKPIPYPQVYTVEEFARLFKLSPEAVRNLIRKGEIAAIRIGKQYRLPQDVVDRFFAQAISPEERGCGMWRPQPIESLTYVNNLREVDHRTPEAFLKDMHQVYHGDDCCSVHENDGGDQLI